MNVPAFASIFALCFYNAFFLSSRRLEILLQIQNAFDLAFPPFDISLGKVEGGKSKREVETGQNVGFSTPRSTYGRAEGKKWENG